jgi:4-alpha-glucanotransferase
LNAEGTARRQASGLDGIHRKQLFELAGLYGIQTSYINMAKKRQQADPDVVLLVLRAMGVETESFDDVPDALIARKEKLKNRKVDPVMVAWDGKLNGRHFEFGYHDAEINGEEAFVISAPTKAYFPSARASKSSAAQAERQWGAFAPVYALHSKRNRLAGDLTDFEEFMDWIGSYGGTVMATLPLLAAFLDEPFEPSPYSPASRLFWNEFYIDFTRIPEFSASAEAVRIAGEAPQRTKYVDYKAVMAWKRRLLEQLAQSFFSDATPERLHAFGTFVRTHRGVEDYAKFRAVTDHLRKGWTQWPAKLRDGKIDAADYDEATKHYHLYVQWIIQEQLEALSIKANRQGQMLYLDLPLGLHPDGYDLWRDREFFVQNVAAGAPPDLVFTKGQNWGFPPMNPEAMRLNRYQYYIAFIRNHLRFARLLRVDHVMGLHRLYWIPNEFSGEKGVYVEYPAEELYAILSLESHRHEAGIVGENLGTVPPAVNAAMSRHNIAQMYVVQYEIVDDPKKPRLKKPSRKAVASLNTHDMPPFRSFYEGTDIDDRVDLGFLTTEMARTERKERALQKKTLAGFLGTRNYGGIFREVMRFLADSMANIVLVNVEDLWEEVRPQNVPATNTERPNWRRRMRPDLGQMRRMARVGDLFTDVFAKRSRSLPL